MAPPKSKNPKKTAKYYDENPEAKAKKDAYNKEYNKKPEQRAKRSELVQERRDRGVYGKGGKDMSHTKDGKIVAEDPSTNRGRNRGKK
ncbi:hypothetical protein EBT31_19465 [bacterium]|jgi:hypothetical protein|nr:hypothetical protein [bacterium]